MDLNQLPIFKELSPYSGQIDTENRWIKLSKLVPWDEMDELYRRHFDPSKHSVIKDCRLIMGLFLGQMLLKLSDREIVEYFHENLYFQYFCGKDSFVAKVSHGIIHPSLLSKRRKRLGKTTVAAFEKEIWKVLKEKGTIKGHRLMLDATVFPAHITYPSDIKLLNSVREYLCKTILDVKKGCGIKKAVRTYRRCARKVFLNVQKRKRKTRKFIRKSHKKMSQYVARNITQLETMLDQAIKQTINQVDTHLKSSKSRIKAWEIQQIKKKLRVSKEILRQQQELLSTRGPKVNKRIVSFHWPECRPIVRGKEGKRVEFGPKAHLSLTDGYIALDHVSNEAFHEGILLEDSLNKHRERYGKDPEVLLADQLYANRANRALLDEKGISHSFKPVGRPPDDSLENKRKRKQKLKIRQGERNHIEATFGHLKNRFNLDKITWRGPDGMAMQIQMGLMAYNLSSALAKG